jgi:hypothetical protein
MSYGRAYNPAGAADEQADPRGLVFMAYNASISEQFEVIQRWITGGNSAGGFSRQSDPFLGVPDWNESRAFRFEDNGTVHRIALDAAPAPSTEPQPLVRLEWGMYLFTPSLSALRKLAQLAGSSEAVPPLAPAWSVEEGKAKIDELLLIEDRDAAITAWKAALEDGEAQEKYHSAGVWAAIRQYHGGALRTPYGVLVADGALVMQVLGDQDGQYTVEGYRERMQTSLGEIYLGLDANTDGEYERQSRDVNAAISDITERQAFELALKFTTDVLGAFIQGEKQNAQTAGLPGWELDLDAKEVVDQVLALLCREWFGLPDGTKASDALVAGSWRWDWKYGDRPIYPAHFLAPSRYIFQPQPGAEVRNYGCTIGTALTEAMKRFLANYVGTPNIPQSLSGKNARLAEAILRAFPQPADADLVARTFSGVLMGFLPTVDGNFRLSLNELLRDGTFWSLRSAWAALGTTLTPFEKTDALLREPFLRAMELRPSPELVWRRAACPSRIGDVDVQTGETVVAALVSATQQCLPSGPLNVCPVFGGSRASSPHPTHACPGYRAGMGVLLGMLAGFMNVGERMRASPVPLAFTFEG